jgi:hypothetical protein
MPASRELNVLLADLERSRSVRDREQVRERLEKSFEQLNSDHHTELTAGFSILKGIDEIGAVFASFGRVYRAITFIEQSLHPLRMRFVLVRGEVDTALESGDVARMDGPAFHLASELLEGLKDSRLPFSMSAGDKLLDDTLGGMVNFALMARGDWSERQRSFMSEYERTGNQTDAAEALGVTQQAVSSALVSSRYKQVKMLEETIDSAFERYAMKIESGGESDVDC